MRFAACLTLVISANVCAEGVIDVPVNDQMTVMVALTKDDLTLLEWAKKERAKSDKIKHIGATKYLRQEMWLDKGRQQFEVFSGNANDWGKLDEAAKQAWVRVAKVNQAGLCGWHAGEQVLKGVVEGDHFVLSGRFREVEQFYISVLYTRRYSFEHGDYSLALQITSLVEGLLKQTRDRKGGLSDDEKPVKVSWQIKSGSSSDREMLTAINEVIEIWPGKLLILATDGIEQRETR